MSPLARDRSIPAIAIFFLVLLRLAIGWHFFYEGAWKLQSQESEAERFSAEVYLANASGPLAKQFRSLADDADGFARLDRDTVIAQWNRQFEAAKSHLGLNEEQAKLGAIELDAAVARLKSWFDDAETKRKIADYRNKLESYRNDQSRVSGFGRKEEWMKSRWTEIQGIKRDLVGSVDGWNKELVSKWNGLAGPGRIESVGRYRPSRGNIDLIDKLTMFGLLAVGVGLIFGFLTRLAALGATALLALFYLSQPPFPGLPLSPMSEGHYLFVNKNLIEMLATLAFVFLPSGRWFGVDALFARVTRRLAAADESTTSA